MNKQDILTLARAGFTAQQIAALNQVQPAQAPVSNNDSGQIAGIQNQIAQLTGMVQAGAIANASQPKQETTDDILASIIAPPVNQNGGNAS